MAVKRTRPRPANYREARAREYPPEGDQLDALWKAFNQMRMDGTALPQDADDMLGKVLSVKKKHPKPDGK